MRAINLFVILTKIPDPTSLKLLNIGSHMVGFEHESQIKQS